MNNIIPRRLSYYRAPNGFSASLYLCSDNEVNQKQWALIKPVHSNNIINPHLIGNHKFLNGAIYAHDDYESNHGRAISVGNLIPEEYPSKESSLLKEPFDGNDVYIRRCPPGVNVIISHFDKKTLIRIMTPDNCFMDVHEKRLFQAIRQTDYNKIVSDILSNNNEVKALLKYLSSTATYFLHYHLRVCSPKFHSTTPEDKVYLMDVTQTFTESEPAIYDYQALYEVQNLIGIPPLPLINDCFCKDFQDVINFAYQNQYWQCIIYFNNNQSRVKITNTRLESSPGFYTVSDFTIDSIIARFSRQQVHPDNFNTFISDELKKANTLKTDAYRDEALENIQEFQLKWARLSKKLLSARAYTVSLLASRGCMEDIKPQDKSWFSEQINKEIKSTFLKAAVWALINKASLPFASIACELQKKS